MDKAELLDSVAADADRLESLSRTLWETPEVALEETESAELLISVLEDEGFDVERGVGGMPTAFVAEYGDGSSTVGILGEYDALPGLSQQVSAERDPVEEGGPGHGCGHNLFAVGSLGGALAVKRAIADGSLDGTVRFYGCPAEETLVGKVYMARAGVFDDLDAAFTWHPSQSSYPFMARTLAMNSVKYEFEGESAHAANSPESGRSALDGVQLMNTGAEYMREHISDEARVHYSIEDGGQAPNVVPPEATVWYYVRAPTREEVERINDWLDDIAEAAATMSQTSVEREFVTGCYDYLPNDRLSAVVHRNMQEIGAVPFTDEDRAFAADLKETLPEETIRSQMSDVPEDRREEILDHALYAEPTESFDAGEVHAGSTEVGDVSWIAPLAQFWAAAWPVGTPSHTWQAVAANGDFGAKTAVYAAKVLAASAYDVLEDPTVLDEAREEFEEATGGRAYETPLPEGTEPPVDAERQ
ncbi:amidohydrolase [Halorussus halobius]|uniref:amidohydrolase n=1 Tax=Halorussus halobius TaxID=1710537 RepID=UPI00109282B6|nr:amidohydrolase [Halorussus halobius]